MVGISVHIWILVNVEHVLSIQPGSFLRFWWPRANLQFGS